MSDKLYPSKINMCAYLYILKYHIGMLLKSNRNVYTYEDNRYIETGNRTSPHVLLRLTSMEPLYPLRYIIDWCQTRAHWATDIIVKLLKEDTLICKILLCLKSNFPTSVKSRNNININIRFTTHIVTVTIRVYLFTLLYSCWFTLP